MVKQNQLKRHRGSLTIAIAILLALVIALSAILNDYSRVANAKPVIEMQASNAIDVALMGYDENFYDEFKLYALDDIGTAESKIRSSLEILGSNENKSLNRFTINQVDVTFTNAALANKAVLKHMIIENYSKDFVAGKAVDWFDRLEAFKHLSKVTSMMTKLSNLLEKMHKLDRLFSLLTKSYQVYQEFLELAESININAELSSLESLNQDYDEAEEAITDFVAEHKGELDTKENKEKLKSLKATKASIAKSIDEIEHRLTNFLAKGKALAAYLKNLQDFSEQLNDCLMLANQVRAEAASYADEKLDKYSNESINKISTQAKSVIDGLQASNSLILENIKKLNTIVGQFNTIADEINAVIAGAKAEILKQTQWLENMSDVEQIEINFLKQNPDKNSANILSSIGKSLLNSVIADFNYNFGEIPSGVYGSLPSRKTTVDKFERIKGGGTSFYRRMQRDSSLFHTILTKLADLGDGIVQKMVLTDYILNNFSYQTNRENGSHQGYIKGAECEYILFGQRSGGANVIATEGHIFAIRMVLNSISIFAFKHIELEEIAITLAAASGGLSYPVWLGISLLGWASAESYVDVVSLKNGGTAKLFKFSSDIRVSLSSQSLEALEEILPDEVKFIGDNLMDLKYEDYLFLLFLVKDEDKILYRLSDMIATAKSQQGRDFNALQTSLKVNLEAELTPWYSNFTLNNDLPITKNKRFNYCIERGY